MHVAAELPESPILDPVDPKDRHVVVTAMVAQADAIVTFNLADFAASHLSEKLQIEVIHPDDFVIDLVDLNEKRAVAAFRELRARKKNPPMESAELIRRLRDGGLVETVLMVEYQWRCGVDLMFPVHSRGRSAPRFELGPNSNATTCLPSTVNISAT